MGCFGTTKTEILVGTSVVAITDSDTYLSPMKAAIYRTVNTKKKVLDQHMDNLLSGMGVKGRKLYSKASQGYIWGLPKGTVISPVSAAAEVQEAIEEEVSDTVLLAYSRFGFLNYPHLALKSVSDMYGLDLATGELPGLTTIKGTVITLETLVMTVPADTFDAIPPEGLVSPAGGLFEVRFARDPLATDVAVTIKYSWITPVWNPNLEKYEGVTHTDTEVVVSSLPIPDYSPEQDFFHAAYVLGGVAYFWLYRKGDGTHAALDSFYDVAFSENGSYFPWIYFRFNATSADADPESEEYIQSRNLCRIIGLDYQEMIDKIHSQGGIGDVQQAFLWFAVPAVSTNPVELKYLYAYWQEAYASQGGQFTAESREDFIGGFTAGVARPHNNVIRDARFTMILKHNGIWKRSVTGVFGKVGDIKTEVGHLASFTAYTDENGVPRAKFTGWGYHCYMKQVSETEYEEIQVLDLKLHYHVYGEEFSTGDLDTDSSILFLPLDMAIVENMSLVERDELYTRSLRMVFNSMIMEKVKWYQQGVFRTFLTAFAIFLAVIGLAPVAMNFFSALAAAETVMAVALAIAEFVFTTFLISEAFTWAVKVIGVENAFILAVLSVIQAVRTGDLSAIKNLLNFANVYMQITLGLIHGITSYEQDALKEIQEDLATARSEYAAEMDKLAEIWKEIRGSPIMHYIVNPGEKVEAFKARTMNPVAVLQETSGKPGNFVQQAKYIPTPKPQEINYG